MKFRNTRNQLSFKPVTWNDVQRILSMPLNKLPGIDNVRLRAIQDSLPVRLGPLTYIINRASPIRTSTYGVPQMHRFDSGTVSLVIEALVICNILIPLVGVTPLLIWKNSRSMITLHQF